MAIFILLHTAVYSSNKWVNMDRVEEMEVIRNTEGGQHTALYYASGGDNNIVKIKETPEEIMALMEPGGAVNPGDPPELQHTGPPCPRCIRKEGEEDVSALCMECQANEYDYFMGNP